MRNQKITNFPGARWWRFDLHTHTPASLDYGKGPDAKNLRQISPHDWLLGYMKAGIDCVAVTDHNTGEWIDRLKISIEEVKSELDYRPMVLFPGVEISVNGGIHILAIFDTSKTSADITRLLGAVGYSGTMGQSDDVTQKSPVEVIQEIVAAGGLAIPAHADQDRGLFKVLNGTSLANVLDSGQISAIELFDVTYPLPQLYVNRKLAWPPVLCTDGHHPGPFVTASGATVYPGSHYTWIKMGQPNIEGLRLSLIDGVPLSVRRSDVETGDPNRHAENLVESIQIEDARYCGRGRPLSAEFNPWLNAIIGGRGTGKSTIVEFLRIAARRVEELPERMQNDFNDFQRLPGSRDDRGALTEKTRVDVVYRTETGRYRLQWDSKASLPPIEEEQPDGTWRHAPGDIRQRFPVRIFSQKQIYAVAEESRGLLKVIDEAPDVDRHAWEIQWGQEEARFLSLRSKARELKLQLAELDRIAGELDDVSRKLKLFESAQHANVLKEYQRRQRQHRALREFGESLGAIEKRLSDVADSVLPAELDRSLFDMDDPADKDALDQAVKIDSALQTLRSELEASMRRVQELHKEWQTSFEQSVWLRAFLKSNEAYETLISTLRGQGAGDPSEYGALVQKRQILEGKLQALKDTALLLEEVQKQAHESLDRLLLIRRDLSNRRAAFLQTVLSGNRYVRIELIPYGKSLRDTESQFRSLIGREDWFEEDILSMDENKGLVADLYQDLPKDNSEAAMMIEQRLNVMKRDLLSLAGGQSIPRFGKRFQTFLSKLPAEVLDRLETWFPEDSLAVSYSSTADGLKFRSILQASPGQKTAAILAFLLAYGNEPMVIDQPEDDLDNHLIYDLIVRQLRENKTRRQLIIVTHNPNIVVNGDAELILAMDHCEGQCCLVQQGSLQNPNVREEVCRIMEGGREAFAQRYRRIGGGEYV